MSSDGELFLDKYLYLVGFSFEESGPVSEQATGNFWLDMRSSFGDPERQVLVPFVNGKIAV